VPESRKNLTFLLFQQATRTQFCDGRRMRRPRGSAPLASDCASLCRRFGSRLLIGGDRIEKDAQPSLSDPVRLKRPGSYEAPDLAFVTIQYAGDSGNACASPNAGAGLPRIAFLHIIVAHKAKIGLEADAINPAAANVWQDRMIRGRMIA
jgi:hypothetical protein